MSFHASSQIGNGKAHIVEFDDPLLAGRQEVALLVEDVVERQQALVLFEKDFTPIKQNRGIHGRLAGVGWSGQCDASDKRGGQFTRGLGKFIHSLTAAGEKARFLKKVGGRISADGQFREDGKSCALVGGATGKGKNFFEIAGEIPDRGVDLRQCDLHTFSLKQWGKKSRMVTKRQGDKARAD